MLDSGKSWNLTWFFVVIGLDLDNPGNFPITSSRLTPKIRSGFIFPVTEIRLSGVSPESLIQITQVVMIVMRKFNAAKRQL